MINNACTMQLYHTKDYQGTTTDECGVAFGD